MICGWYKDHLTALGYNLIEYEWFFLDGMPVSVEIYYISITSAQEPRGTYGSILTLLVVNDIVE
eukprot:scaffold10678_cov130-Skeletonema_marinoi.AAC.11